MKFLIDDSTVEHSIEYHNIFFRSVNFIFKKNLFSSTHLIRFDGFFFFLKQRTEEKICTLKVVLLGAVLSKFQFTDTSLYRFVQVSIVGKISASAWTMYWYRKVVQHRAMMALICPWYRNCSLIRGIRLIYS